MYLFTIAPFVQAHASRLMRAAADRLGVDPDDAGFTTVEKVVLTGIGVAVAVAVGAIIMGKARQAAEEIDPSSGF
jgi:hypothetical protein